VYENITNPYGAVCQKDLLTTDLKWTKGTARGVPEHVSNTTQSRYHTSGLF
jgi:hypothetical protein